MKPLERCHEYLRRHCRVASCLRVGALIALTLAVYLRASFLWGKGSLFGSDYAMLHIRRIAFARAALFGPHHFLPAWYPHELLGTPFAANLQSFPWIPTRLILLLFDPLSAFAVGVAIASVLAALFTYLFCRRMGLGAIGSIAAGWTFACAGFFSSRVMAGHLPLLEAYPSLPLLLWLADRALAPDRSRRDLAWLAAAAAATAAAGHPQLPIYSLTAVVLYSIWRGRGTARIRAILAMALGVGTTCVIWWPMLKLIGRSTRVLHLARPDNDISMPYGRLLALVWPGIDGWPEIVARSGQQLFDNYPTDAYFWDTCSYVGLIPLAAVLALAVGCAVRRRWPSRSWAFLAVLGAGGLVFALPLVDPLRESIPVTLLRSPARLLYVSSFAISVALGYAVTALLGSSALGARYRRLIVAACLLFHLVDLGGFSRRFITTVHWPIFGTNAFDAILTRELHDGRVAAADPIEKYDDVGFFDSLMLANPYRAVLGSAGEEPDSNEQQLDGSKLPIPALQIAGVRFVITPAARPDLELAARSGSQRLYRVPNPVPRAAFIAGDRANYRPRAELLDAFLSEPSRSRVLLPGSRPSTIVAPPAPGTVTYARPSSDEIRLESDSAEAGFAHVLESYDPGWTAEVDGMEAAILPANGFSMAVPVAPGRHTIRLRYRTVGRTTGWALTLLSAGLLLILIWKARPVPAS